jgi:hypothetical protein
MSSAKTASGTATKTTIPPTETPVTATKIAVTTPGTAITAGRAITRRTVSLETILRILARLIHALFIFRSRVVLPVIHSILLTRGVVTIHVA